MPDHDSDSSKASSKDAATDAASPTPEAPASGPTEPKVELVRLGNGEYAGRIIEVIPCTAEDAWRKIADLDRLDTLIPFCDSSTTEAIPGEDAVRLSIAVGLPRPFPRIHYVVRSSLDHDNRTVSWLRISGNLKRNEGSLGFEPLDETRCVARYECCVGVGFHVPRFAEKIMERLLLPKIMATLAARLARP